MGMACRTKGGRGKAGMPYFSSPHYDRYINIVEMDTSYSINSLHEFKKSRLKLIGYI
mgnify:CR=1 FL=1